MRWDYTNYEFGIDRGVFYTQGSPGEPWNGLISVTEAPTDSEGRPRYIDGVKTRSNRKIGYFEGMIEAYTYPESFYVNVMAQRRRTSFGLSYRTMTASGYKIHFLYNCVVKPSSVIYSNDAAATFKWDFTSIPVLVPGVALSAHFIIESSVAYLSTLSEIEGIIYGTDSTDARMPSPTEILDVFESHSILRIIDNGDGSWTAIGPDSAIQMLDATTFQITWPSAVFIDADSYTIRSL